MVSTTLRYQLLFNRALGGRLTRYKHCPYDFLDFVRRGKNVIFKEKKSPQLNKIMIHLIIFAFVFLIGPKYVWP